jgi:hypothetical protein
MILGDGGSLRYLCSATNQSLNECPGVFTSGLFYFLHDLHIPDTTILISFME